jgi:hypothetical protein
MTTTTISSLQFTEPREPEMAMTGFSSPQFTEPREPMRTITMRTIWSTQLSGAGEPDDDDGNLVPPVHRTLLTSLVVKKPTQSKPFF